MTQSRQLAAIMLTDIVGYTALMGSNEENAFRILNANRQIHQSIIDKFDGLWIKELGDGVLVSFHNVSDAVQAALEIQNECKAVKDLTLRIGIHLGEVVFENNDIFGDGVNIAARIQACSHPGSIFISEAVHDNIVNKPHIRTRFVRQEPLKNVKAPVRIYEVFSSASDPTSSAIDIPSHAEEAGKSIAVLPFSNMSSDPDQEYFCDGIAEEIIDTLAQLNNLRVIARTSAFSFKGKNIDVREIGKTLDVATLLEGSVRKSGSRLRITTKLVNVADGSHLWTGRYDREFSDVFAIQEDIATKVATELKGFLTSNEKEVIRPVRTDVEAYDYYLKGRHLFHELNLPESEKMYKKAISVDPTYAPAYAGLSKIHTHKFEWLGGDASELSIATTYSQKALALSPEMAMGHSAYGYVLSLSKRFEEAEAAFQKAIELDPNLFDAYYLCGRMFFACGEIKKSVEKFHQASIVRPEDFQSLLLMTQSLKILGDPHTDEYLKEGLNRVRRQLVINPNDRRALSLGAAWLAEYGGREEAFEWMQKALNLYPEDATTLFNGACLYAQHDEKQKAIQLLEVALEKGFGHKEWIEQDPDYDPLRNEPQFIALMERLSRNEL